MAPSERDPALIASFDLPGPSAWCEVRDFGEPDGRLSFAVHTGPHVCVFTARNLAELERNARDALEVHSKVVSEITLP